MHEFRLWKRRLAITPVLILAFAPALYNQGDRSGVREAPAGPGDLEGVGSGCRARSGGDVQGAGSGPVGDRIRVESRVHARRERAQAQTDIACKAARWSQRQRVTSPIAVNHGLRSGRRGERKVRRGRAVDHQSDYRRFR